MCCLAVLAPFHCARLMRMHAPLADVASATRKADDAMPHRTSTVSQQSDCDRLLLATYFLCCKPQQAAISLEWAAIRTQRSSRLKQHKVGPLLPQCGDALARPTTLTGNTLSCAEWQAAAALDYAFVCSLRALVMRPARLAHHSSLIVHSAQRCLSTRGGSRNP